MKNSSFEKTERAKHRKKQMRKNLDPKTNFTKSILSCYGRLKVIRSQCEANLHHVNETNRKHPSNQTDNNKSVFQRKTEDLNLNAKAENISYYIRLHGIASLKTFFYPHNFLNLIQISIHYKKICQI